MKRNFFFFPSSSFQLDNEEFKNYVRANPRWKSIGNKRKTIIAMQCVTENATGSNAVACQLNFETRHGTRGWKGLIDTPDLMELRIKTTV